MRLPAPPVMLSSTFESSSRPHRACFEQLQLSWVATSTLFNLFLVSLGRSSRYYSYIIAPSATHHPIPSHTTRTLFAYCIPTASHFLPRNGVPCDHAFSHSVASSILDCWFALASCQLCWLIKAALRETKMPWLPPRLHWNLPAIEFECEIGLYVNRGSESRASKLFRMCVERRCSSRGACVVLLRPGIASCCGGLPMCLCPGCGKLVLELRCAWGSRAA